MCPIVQLWVGGQICEHLSRVWNLNVLRIDHDVKGKARCNLNAQETSFRLTYLSLLWLGERG